jgi:Tfp pilus assembly protein PilF/TolB-like protein
MHARPFPRVLLLVLTFLLPAGLMAQGTTAVPGKLLLVLPFDNRSDQPSLDWIGEAAPEVLNRRLASAGFMPISRADRLYALDHLGLPATFQPSRASAIRLAQTLDANYVIVGSFSTTGSRFQAKAQILTVDALHMSAPLQEEADIGHLLDVLNSLAWGLAKQIDPQLALARSTFLAADAGLRKDVFENYMRGLAEPDPAEQIRHLKEAVRLDPMYAPALFALGKAYFANQQFDLAANTLGRLSRNDPNAREADFLRGLAYFYLGSYVKAEDAFAFVSKQLPLPEVVNNRGVAASRRGLDGSAFFQQAALADPSDPDYQFNLALALNKKKDVAGALRAVAQTIKLRPTDTEAQTFQASLRAAPGSTARVNAAFDPAAAADNGPLERIKRTFNEASFRQEALAIEQINQQRLAMLPPQKQAAALTDAGMRFFNQGLILEAEREFQAALVAQSSSANAHAGLALVRQQESDDKEAASEVSAALKIEPQNATALKVKQQLESKGQAIP